jgi:hypothetical protein
MAVAHLVYQSTQDVLVRPIAKGVRVQGQLINEGNGIDSVAKAVVGKVAAAAALALEGDEAWRQAAAK